MEQQNHLMDAGKSIGEGVAGAAHTSKETTEQVVKDIFLEVMTLGKAAFYKGVFFIMIVFGANLLIVFTRKDIGYNSHSLFMACVNFTILMIVSEFMYSFNFVGRYLGQIHFQYSSFIAFAKCYFLVSIVQYIIIRYRERRQAHKEIYTHSRGNSIAFGLYLKVSKRIRWKWLQNEYDYQHYLETPLLFLIGLIIRNGLGWHIGTLISISAVCIYLEIDFQKANLRQQLMAARDMKIISKTMISALHSKEDVPINQNGFKISKATINDLKRSYKSQKTNNDEQLETLQDEQKLD